MKKPTVIRTGTRIVPDAKRVLIRPFIPPQDRVVKIIGRVLSQTDEEVQEHLAKIFEDFSSRHIEVESTLLNRYQSIKHMHFSDIDPPRERRMLIGSYFTSEYSLESAALFNPSMVPHPDQNDLPKGSVRFVTSLRAVGEGHISSVAFRCGTVDANQDIVLEDPPGFVETPNPIVNKEFDNQILAQKFMDMGFNNDYSNRVFGRLSGKFTFEELQAAVSEIHDEEPALSFSNRHTKDNLFWIASANYDIRFDPHIPLGGRALFPYSPSEKHGIEDARFVLFEDDGEKTFYATATAWDGKTILSQLIETKDFLEFKVRSLNGEAVRNKGMALFPRKVDGRYAMLSRQDNENIYLMFSEHLQFWREYKLIMKPAFPWEFYQMGNCGSPMEIPEGWLVITHGVGAMRRYAIGAALLDKDDPSKVLARSPEPFLVPNENEREGYVPNVVYSCGSMIHGDSLILPYAMADYASRIALVSVKELLETLV